MKNREETPGVVRFWSKVDRDGGLNACWPWKAAINKKPNGYGVFGENGRLTPAHRIAMSQVREIPPGKWVLHRCDNPPCCNPSHLFIGDRSDNMKDMVRKGRRRYVGLAGEKHPMAQLSNAAVADIRTSSERNSTLAKRYGVNRDHIGVIRRREAWKHLP